MRAHTPLAFRLGKRCYGSSQQFYMHCLHAITTTTTTIQWPFVWHYSVSQYRKKHLPTHTGAPQGNTCRINNPAVCQPIQTVSVLTSIIPTIFTLDALPAATLPIYPGLGQAQSMLACIPMQLNTH